MFFANNVSCNTNTAFILSMITQTDLENCIVPFISICLDNYNESIPTWKMARSGILLIAN